VNAVTARARANQDHAIVGSARGARGTNLVAREQPHAHGVDQRVVAVALVEHDLAANRRHADAVAIRRDASNSVIKQVPVAGVVVAVKRAKAQRVEQRDRASAHGEHVAQDSADAGRRTLEGLDGRRVVV